MIISIHAAREGGDARYNSKAAAAYVISIHAAREGGDESCTEECTEFAISIHAAREGGDYHGGTARFRLDYFNPRRP